MKALLSLALCAIVLVAFTGVAVAEDKEVTLKGKVTCGKCELKKDSKCATVLVVKDGDKEVVYYFDAASHKKHHGDICQEAKTGTVVGTVSEKDGKKWIKVSKVDFS